MNSFPVKGWSGYVGGFTVRGVNPCASLTSLLGLILTPIVSLATSIGGIERQQDIPDYSYAGYHRSERAIPHVEGPVFNIVDFGAIANDEKSDREAIQKAIDAAAAQGGGVVLVPKGRFDLGQKSNAGSVFIRDSNIVLRGEGSGEDGSVLFMSEYLAPPPPMKLWASPYVFQIGGKRRETDLGKIAKDLARGDWEVEVAQATKLKVGDWIALKLIDNSPALVKTELAGFEVLDPRWKSIISDGVTVTERHQVAAVKGNTIRLTAPVIKPVDTQYNWRVVRYEPLSEIGIENLRLQGAWDEQFLHHKNWLHDGGYSMVSMTGVVNSWIRDCVFVDLNCVGAIDDSAQVTVIDSVIEGNPGHSAIRFSDSTACLMARVEDRAGQWHSVGISRESIGNVLYRCYWGSKTSFESHSSQPRHTLFDTCVGGFLKGHGGGAAQNLPTHVEGLIMWNHLKTNEALADFQFEPLDELYWRIPQPLIVGMHGSSISFRAGQSTVISLGEAVAEGSLYEFQVKRRLGKMPEDLR